MASRKKLGGLPTVLIGLLMLLILSLFRKTKAMEMKPSDVKDKVYALLTKAGINSQTARYWVAVAAHETGGFTSKIFLENNNLFGMRLPSSNTTAIGERYGHAVFSSLEDSVADLILYFQRLKWAKKNFTSISELVNYQKAKNYFEDTLYNYLNGVNYWYSRLYPSM